MTGTWGSHHRGDAGEAVVSRFRVYAIGGVKYLDIEDEAIADVEDIYRHAARAGYLAGLVREEDRTIKVLIPARGSGVITQDTSE